MPVAKIQPYIEKLLKKKQESLEAQIPFSKELKEIKKQLSTINQESFQRLLWAMLLFFWYLKIKKFWVDPPNEMVKYY